MSLRPQLLLAVALLAAAPAAVASGGATPFTFKPDTGNLPSLQRGARDYMAYCSGCHSLKHLRYNRLGRDLEIPDELLSKHLMFTSDKPGDPIRSSMPADKAEQWFGRTPPDLTLTARERGPSWVYSYLMGFYLDPTKPAGVNNLVLPGLAMPHVLGDLQGWQVLEKQDPAADHGGHHSKPPLKLAVPGKLSPEQYREMAGDLTNFLVYAAEPGRNRRMATGVGVLAFILVFGVLSWLLKVEYWKDVH